MKTILTALCTAYLSVFGYAATPAMDFLRSSPSALESGHAAGFATGGSGDPLIALANPATLGLQAETNRLMFTGFVRETDWLAVAPNSRYQYSARSAFYGINSASAGKWLRRQTRFSLGIGYQEIDSHLPGSSVQDRYPTRDNAKYLSVGVGWHSSFAHVAAGLSDKRAVSEYDRFTSRANAMDVGVLAEAELVSALGKLVGSELNFGAGLLPVLSPSVGFAVANMGGRATLPASSIYPRSKTLQTISSPLPRTSELSVGVRTGMDFRWSDTGRIRLLSIDGAVAVSDQLVYQDGHGGYHYQALKGDLKPVRQVFGGESVKQVTLVQGLEFGLAQTVYAGWTRTHDEAALGNYATREYRISLGGLLKMLPVGSLRHLDIQYNRSEWQIPPARVMRGPRPANGTRFERVVVGWAY